MDETPKPCPCCYDGAARASTGVVLGLPCVVCGGSGVRAAFEPISSGYDTEQRPISGDHIAINPDGTITPFRSGRAEGRTR
jgi:hypothetical protein